MNGFFLVINYDVLYIMVKTTHVEVLIIGGGLAGLTAGIHLSQHGFQVLLLEKYAYPHHKVCGEYVSNEVLPYLKQLGLDPIQEGAKNITTFQISNVKGKSINTALPMGGFGISRYHLDHMLYQKLVATAAVEITTVSHVSFQEERFVVETQTGAQYTADFVLGAYGKRSNLDLQWKRNFTQQPSQWLGVKAHYQFDMPESTVALHNFNGGYCGLSQTETGAVNACYLASYESFKKYKNIEVFQREIVSQNPYLKTFFEEATLLFDAPLTISQISFSEKKAVENHVIMLGDSAGLIHPLCGNGMAMAIHSAKLFSEIFIKNKKEGLPRKTIEDTYALHWQTAFSRRLRVGKLIQRLLLKPKATRLGFTVAKAIPGIVPMLIKQTHGKIVV